MVDHEAPLSVRRQCELLRVSTTRRRAPKGNLWVREPWKPAARRSSPCGEVLRSALEAMVREPLSDRYAEAMRLTLAPRREDFTLHEVDVTI